MKKFYITTSIPYANAAPHIGFALEAVQADVLARFNRESGRDVFYLTGTDEHGLKIKKAARLASKTPQQFVDEISQKFIELAKALNISNDGFIRTTDEKRHRTAVEKIWVALEKNGDIYKKKYKGYYCAGCEAFVTEKDLINGKCPLHSKEPELIEEENYFFKLSKYLPKIKKRIEDDKLAIFPNSKKREVLGFILGMGDISFSRSKDKYWGIPVPGDKEQVIYVWGDALPNYISGIGYGSDKNRFKKYWPADVHCIGKDILKFHAVIWPAMLLSLKLKLPKSIFVHGFIGVNGQKMSKSLGNVVDPFELIEKYGADALRYYLLREIPSSEDGDFSIEKFEQRYNSDLASGIGNLVSRVESLKNKIGFGKKYSTKVKKEISKTQKNCKKAIQNFKFNEGLKSIWELIGFCDKYIEMERPWENKNNSKQVISDLNFAAETIAELIKPFLPGTSEKIKNKELPLFPRIC
ncbi:MAG: class I tRNA ligase family protein [bacterium]|nr:class I tRNA ligase family protein [bacterium]